LWRFLLRLRFLLWLVRFVFVPLLAFLLAFLVFFIILWSLYLLLIAKTLEGLRNNPYLFLPLLLVEILVLGSVLYLAVMYINKLREKLKVNPGGRL